MENRIKVAVRVLRNLTNGLHKELVRKSIHISIGLVPMMASLNYQLTALFLASGILLYAYAEYRRILGYEIPVISRITRMASRERDKGKMVFGPITLGLGALLCLLLYPSPVASVAIYSLAFADGLSSLVGKFFGRIKLPFTGGKTLEGSAAAFGIIYLIVLQAGQSHQVALSVAAIGTLIEAMPLEDMDNIAIPFGVAMAFQFLAV